MPAVRKPEEPDKVMKYIRSVRGLSIRIADACDIKRAAVYQWTQVPVERIHDVAKVLGWKPEKIRPDIFKRR
jgi:hypothetical protein